MGHTQNRTVIGPVLLNGFFSCDTCNPAPYRYSIQDYKPFLRKLVDKPYLVNTLVANDTISYTNLELLLVGTEIRVATNSFSISGSSTWACDPAVIAMDSIKHLTVTSNQSFNARLGAGADLSTLLTIGSPGYQTPLPIFLGSSNKSAQSFYSLRFNQAPDRMAQHRFTITVDLGKGRVSTVTTSPVVLRL